MLKFLFLFIATVSFSQDLEHLAKQDTVYIFLKNIDKNFSDNIKGLNTEVQYTQFLLNTKLLLSKLYL